MKIFNIGETFSIKVNTKSLYFNSPEIFKLSYFTDENKNPIETNNIFSEILFENKDKRSKTTEEAPKGSKEIRVEALHSFEKGELVKIENDFYIIKEVDGTLLKLSSGLTSDVENETTVEFSNLSGIYITDISFSEKGNYTLVIKNTVTGKSFIASVTVDEKNNENIFRDETFV